MKHMPMCPMMMAQMPMGQMPMAQMPMMQQMNICIMEYQEEEKDEEYFAGMYGDDCHRMIPYVKKAIDKMEQKGEMIYQEYPEKQMVDRMSEDAYNSMVKDMPEMSDEMEERQYGGRRRFGRDLVRLLLINELLRRRRRRRRRDHDYDSFGYGDDFYYNE